MGSATCVLKGIGWSMETVRASGMISAATDNLAGTDLTATATESGAAYASCPYGQVITYIQDSYYGAGSALPSDFKRCVPTCCSGSNGGGRRCWPRRQQVCTRGGASHGQVPSWLLPPSRRLIATAWLPRTLRHPASLWPPLSLVQHRVGHSQGALYRQARVHSAGINDLFGDPAEGSLKILSFIYG